MTPRAGPSPGRRALQTALARAPAGGGSRLLAAPVALSPRPARLAPSSWAGREFVCFSSLSPDLSRRLPGGAATGSLPAGATFTPAAAASLRPGRSCGRAGQEAARRRSPLRYGRRCRRRAAEGGRIAGVRAGGGCAAAPLRPTGPGWTRPPASPPPRGPPAWGRGGRGAGGGRPLLDAARTRDRCAPAAAPAAPRSGSTRAVPRGVVPGMEDGQERKRKVTREAKRKKRRDVYGGKAPYTVLCVLRGCSQYFHYLNSVMS